MAFRNEILPVSNFMRQNCAPVVFHKIRSTYQVKSKRNRQCYWCTNIIKKGDNYINHQYKYDRKIITISFHPNCFL